MKIYVVPPAVTFSVLARPSVSSGFSPMSNPLCTFRQPNLAVDFCSVHRLSYEGDRQRSFLAPLFSWKFWKFRQDYFAICTGTEHTTFPLLEMTKTHDNS